MTNKKTNFKPFTVGTVFNPIKGGPYKIYNILRKVVIRYPTRLDLMAIDPSKISENNNLVYTPGEIILKINYYRTVTVKIIDKNKGIVITNRSKRHSLIMHAALLMKKVLKFDNGLLIDVENSDELRHVGFGSSSALIASVACAINEIFGKPILAKDLVQYTAQNHGEEIDGKNDRISPVQCIGGSSAGGQYAGALMVLAGESRVVGKMYVSPKKYNILIGLPKDFVQLDADTLLKKELNVMDKFVNCGKIHGTKIAYKILHHVLPAMVEGDLPTVGDLIYEYRFEMGSIDNCSYCYPPLTNLCKKLSFLKKDGLVDLLSISSVGPAIVAVTGNMSPVIEAFEKENLKVYKFKPDNRKYTILKKEK